MDTARLSSATPRWLPPDFRGDAWPDIAPYFDELAACTPQNAAELRQWLRDRGALEMVLAERLGWHYIGTTRHTQEADLREAYRHFVSEITPRVAAQQQVLNAQLLASPHQNALADDPALAHYLRYVRRDVQLFREKNIPLLTQIDAEQQQYGACVGSMTIEWKGNQLTLPEASDLLRHHSRRVRRMAYRRLANCRLQAAERLDSLFDRLVRLRHQVAEQANFVNFRDYTFCALGRFDYSAQDCQAFHTAVAREVVPLLDRMVGAQQRQMNLPQFRPWDSQVDALSRPPLQPFRDTDQLLARTIACFDRLDPYMGDCLRLMQQKGNFDLAARKDKAPGGYSYPLHASGVPFIFMNATSTLRDMITLLHEGGHAVHAFLMNDLELPFFRQPPAEVAELAAMAMELLTMDHWEVFFDQPADRRRAKAEHLRQILETLPWVATVDAFQHWVYENPEHTRAERQAAWERIFTRFSDTVTCWEGLEDVRGYLWQKQLHIFEVPFYYIEYGIAQLGAIALWKSYRADPAGTLRRFRQALALGHTVPIREVYATAGIAFDFSADYIRELLQFVWEEWLACAE